MDSAGQLCWSHWGSLLQLQLDGSWDYDVQNGFIHCLTPWGTAGSPGFTPRFHVIQGFSLRTWPFHMISPAEHLIFLYSSSGIPKVQSGSCLALLRLVCRTAVMLPLPYSKQRKEIAKFSVGGDWPPRGLNPRRWSSQLSQCTFWSSRSHLPHKQNVLTPTSLWTPKASPHDGVLSSKSCSNSDGAFQKFSLRHNSLGVVPGLQIQIV